MNIAFPDKQSDRIDREFRSKLVDALLYLCEVTGIASPNLNLSQISPNWRTYGHYNACVRALELDDIATGKDHLSRALSMLAEPRIAFSVVSLVDSDGGVNDIAMIRRELLRETDALIGIGFLTDRLLIRDVQSKVEEAIRIIRCALPSFAVEIEETTTEILITGGTEGQYVRSASCFGLFGLVVINGSREFSVLHYLEHIIHEAAHIRLMLVTINDELTLNPRTERFEAPFRADLRPMNGLFHAYFVLTRILLAFSILRRSSIQAEWTAELDARIVASLKRFFETARIIESNAQFTNLGKEIFHECMLAVVDADINAYAGRAAQCK